MDFFKNFDRSQEVVIDSLKTLLYRRHNDIFDRLDFEDDEIYLEPLLYSYLTQDDDIWLDSIIYGYEKNPQERIVVFSNNKGIIYIPKIGYFFTEKKEEKLFLEKCDDFFLIKDIDNVAVSFNYEPIIYLDEKIELIKTQHPLFERFFINNQNIIVDIDIDEVYSKHISHFNNALQLIKDTYFEYFDLIRKAVKKIIIYEGEPYSFAAIQAHNMIFLNANDKNDDVFFLDHILHEGAHVIFNTLTYISKAELFTVPFKTNMSDITKDISDHGELYGRFHGLFTQSNINFCMERCISENVFKGRQYKELLGRFSSNMKRFRSGVKTFDIPWLYKEEGKLWYDFFAKRYKDLYGRNKIVIESFDVSNQPYIFSYEIFDKTNS
ncbi:hypothetical protein M2T92_16400 [Elizabethkingia miricola]|uniref:hypothetical protein n=1 Tax=Elizabethkingia miricola TaxID=172045 RepID=UPI002012BD94|nr:hypothetical protein [Elizabethkingia miricola]MCL1680621.1 hypothetical protein [Elizabethkingia miricola]